MFLFLDLRVFTMFYIPDSRIYLPDFFLSRCLHSLNHGLIEFIDRFMLFITFLRYPSYVFAPRPDDSIAEFFNIMTIYGRPRL